MNLNSKVICFLICCGLTAVYADPWPTYHAGADLRGVSQSAIPDSLQRKWIYNTDGKIKNPPVSDGKLIFTAPGNGRITALSLNGKMVWEKTFSRTNDAGAETPFCFDAPLLCHGGLVFAGSSGGVLFALDAGTGKERWRLEIDGILLGSPNVIDAEHIIVLGQGSGALHCVAIKSGKVTWTTEGLARCDGSPGVGQGYVAFGSCLAALHVYRAEDGRHLRDIEVGDEGQIAGGVAVDGHRGYFGTRDGRLISVNLKKGTVVWTSSESTEQTFSTPAVGDKYVVYTSDNGWVYAVDRTTGRTLWKHHTGGRPGSAVIAGDKVLVPVEGNLIMLKLVDGSMVWKQSVSDDITSVAVVNGFVIVGADDGSVSAWGPDVPRKEEVK